MFNTLFCDKNLDDWNKINDIENALINKNCIISRLVSIPLESEHFLSIFSHIPKTGGTSMESILVKNFLMSDSLHVNAPDLIRQPNLLELKKNYPKLICGHHPIHGYIYQALPDQPLFHFTQLRDPIDRVISYYNYIHAKQDHPLHLQAQDKNLTDFINTTPSPEMANGQAKRFSGYLHSEAPNDEVLLSTALKTLNTCFSLVLTTCLFDEGLLLLKNRLKLKDIYYERSNVSTKIIKRADLSKQELILIQSKNQADIALFDWAKTRCLELVNKELSSEMIDEFRSKNQQWNQLING